MITADTRVLAIDDDPDVLLLFRLALEREGYRAELVTDGPTALQRVEEDHPDLILLDVMMPGMDGWEVLQRLSRLSSPPRVVVVSARAGSEDRARAFDLGAAEYITKPFDPDALLRTLHDVLVRGESAIDAASAERSSFGAPGRPAGN